MWVVIAEGALHQGFDAAHLLAHTELVDGVPAVAPALALGGFDQGLDCRRRLLFERTRGGDGHQQHREGGR